MSKPRTRRRMLHAAPVSVPTVPPECEFAAEICEVLLAHQLGLPLNPNAWTPAQIAHHANEVRRLAVELTLLIAARCPSA